MNKKMLLLMFVFAVTLVLIGGEARAADATWYDNGSAYYYQLNISHGNGSFLDHPTIINLSNMTCSYADCRDAFVVFNNTTEVPIQHWKERNDTINLSYIIKSNSTNYSTLYGVYTNNSERNTDNTTILFDFIETFSRNNSTNMGVAEYPNTTNQVWNDNNAQIGINGSQCVFDKTREIDFTRPSVSVKEYNDGIMWIGCRFSINSSLKYAGVRTLRTGFGARAEILNTNSNGSICSQSIGNNCWRNNGNNSDFIGFTAKINVSNGTYDIYEGNVKRLEAINYTSNYTINALGFENTNEGAQIILKWDDCFQSANEFHLYPEQAEIIRGARVFRGNESNNTVGITVIPSNVVDYGTTTTITCSPNVGTATVEINGTNYGTSPQSLILGTGLFNATCKATASGYIDVENSTTITVGSITAGTAGCSDNATYGFSGQFLVTNNTSSVIDMQTYKDLHHIRADIEDVRILGYDYWINASRYVIINTTGVAGTVINVSFGNELNNLSLNKTWGGDVGVTNTLTNLTVTNNYIVITYLDELTQTLQFPPTISNMSINLYCDGGQVNYNYDTGTSNFYYMFATNTSWNESTTEVTYPDNTTYTRNQMFTNNIEESVLFYLIDADQYSTAKVVNELIDYTGLFSFPNTANITIKKWIGSNLRIVDKRQFDASNLAFFYGIVNDRYQYYVQGNGEERTFGSIIVDPSDLTKTIVISQVVRDRPEEYFNNITYYSTYNNTTGLFTFYWDDPYEQTNNINITLTNIDNDTTEYFGESTSSTVTFSTTVQNKTARYKYYVQYDHDPVIGTGVIVGYVGALFSGAWVYATNIYWIAISFVALLITILSTSFISVPFGLISCTLFLIFFIYKGLISLPIGSVAILVGITIMLLLRRMGEDP